MEIDLLVSGNRVDLEFIEAMKISLHKGTFLLIFVSYSKQWFRRLSLYKKFSVYGNIRIWQSSNLQEAVRWRMWVRNRR